VRFLADFKKLDAERKGDKKEEIKSKKLMEENLDDLRGRGDEEKYFRQRKDRSGARAA
jgi:hypothetical protein